MTEESDGATTDERPVRRHADCADAVSRAEHEPRAPPPPAGAARVRRSAQQALAARRPHRRVVRRARRRPRRPRRSRPRESRPPRRKRPIGRRPPAPAHVRSGAAVPRTAPTPALPTRRRPTATRRARRTASGRRALRIAGRWRRAGVELRLPARELGSRRPTATGPPNGARRVLAAIAVVVLVLASAGVGAAVSAAVHSNEHEHRDAPFGNGSGNGSTVRQRLGHRQRFRLGTRHLGLRHGTGQLLGQLDRHQQHPAGRDRLEGQPVASSTSTRRSTRAAARAKPPAPA